MEATEPGFLRKPDATSERELEAGFFGDGEVVGGVGGALIFTRKGARGVERAAHGRVREVNCKGGKGMEGQGVGDLVETRTADSVAWCRPTTSG